jgi:hypothetical protein
MIVQRRKENGKKGECGNRTKKDIPGRELNLEGEEEKTLKNNEDNVKKARGNNGRTIR